MNWTELIIKLLPLVEQILAEVIKAHEAHPSAAPSLLAAVSVAADGPRASDDQLQSLHHLRTAVGQTLLKFKK